jgi:hypothetical protein
MKENELTEPPSETDQPDSPTDELRARLEKLELDSQENRRQTDQRVILAELKVEALRANILDLDGLRFLDMTQDHLGEDGNAVDSAEIISRLRRAKPWLFAAPSSSSVAKVPLSAPTRQKLAKDMSDAEYRVARANVIKRTSF